MIRIQEYLEQLGLKLLLCVKPGSKKECVVEHHISTVAPVVGPLGFSIFQSGYQLLLAEMLEFHMLCCSGAQGVGNWLWAFTKGIGPADPGVLRHLGDRLHGGSSLSFGFRL